MTVSTTEFSVQTPVAPAHLPSTGPHLDYSIFTSVSSVKSCKCHSADWSELVAQVRDAKTYSSKKQQPLIKLATFGDRRNEKGSIRHDGNVEQVYGLEADYDAGVVTTAEAALRLRQADICAVVYTSASHTANAPRWRVLAPLSAPVRPTERHRYISLLNGALGGILAPESWVLSQTYYQGRVEGVEYEVHIVDGEPIDIVELSGDLTEMPPAARMKAAAVPAKARSAADIEDPVVEYLNQHDMILAMADDGLLHVRCPWEHEHTTASPASSTAYLPAGVGGQKYGGFKCLHSHCSGRNVGDFLQAIGYVAAQFELIETPPGEEELAVLPAMQRNAQGRILATRNNLHRILTGDGHWAAARIGFDSLRERVMIAPPGTAQWRPLLDEHYTAIAKRLETGPTGFVHIPSELMREMVRFVAHENSFDSAKGWLESLRWDGVARVEKFLSAYLGVADSPYARAVSRYLWTALAGRALEPGVKADMVPVLVGPQGTGKSSIVRCIAPTADTFLELDLSQSEDEQARLMRGKLVIEFGELRGLRRREQDALKAFIARQVDVWRPKFQEMDRAYPRRSVFVGTTNTQEFLEDETGHRRWLPVDVPHRDQAAVTAAIRALEHDRDQLWAEGAALFTACGVERAMAETLAREETPKYEAIDPWTSAIGQWLEDRCIGEEGADGPPNRDRPFTSADVIVGALGMPLSGVHDANRKRVTRALKGLGFEAERRMVNGARTVVFVQKAARSA